MFARGVGFKRTVIFITNMAERYLHKGSDNYDTSNPRYACGETVEHRPNMTDAQAMALKTCPKCFPNGLKLKGRKVVATVEKREGWL